MTIILSAIMAAFPNAFLALLMPLVTQKFMTKILSHVILYGLQMAAKMTTNKIDDQIVKDIGDAFNHTTTSTQSPAAPRRPHPCRRHYRRHTTMITRAIVLQFVLMVGAGVATYLLIEQIKNHKDGVK